MNRLFVSFNRWEGQGRGDWLPDQNFSLHRVFGLRKIDFGFRRRSLRTAPVNAMRFGCVWVKSRKEEREANYDESNLSLHVQAVLLIVQIKYNDVNEDFVCVTSVLSFKFKHKHSAVLATVVASCCCLTPQDRKPCCSFQNFSVIVSGEKLLPCLIRADCQLLFT